VRNWPGRLIITFIAIILASCVSGTKTNFNLPLQLPLLHKTVYVENGVEEWQKIAIIGALDEWECATGDMVHFEIKFESTEENSMFTDPYYTIVIKNTFPENPQIVKADEDRKSDSKTIGFYTRTVFGTPLILLVNDRLNEYLYRATVEHEVGHALGLIHDTNENSIMYPGVDVGAKHITKKDLKQFCGLYKCKEDELKRCIIR
jgi:hypothetical protein